MTLHATIFDIQKFSIHDGPGIRTIIFLKGCPLHCQWCANPESNNVQPELLYYPNHCIGCKACIAQCQSGAINVMNDIVAFDHSRCTGCLKCAEVCHSTARRISGKSMSAEEVLMEIEKDTVFYESSGGGITFSGGEPLLWPDFIKELSTTVKNRGINTAIETCGFYPQDNFEVVKDVIDLVMFDIKLINDEKHIKYCGASNKQILSNFKTIIQYVPVIIRVPIIPGVNDTPKDINSIIEFITPYKNAIKEINLLPYHNLGISKYDALGRPYPLKDMAPPSEAKMKRVKEMFEYKGYAVKVGG